MPWKFYPGTASAIRCKKAFLVTNCIVKVEEKERHFNKASALNRVDCNMHAIQFYLYNNISFFRLVSSWGTQFSFKWSELKWKNILSHMSSVFTFSVWSFWYFSHSERKQHCRKCFVKLGLWHTVFLPQLALNSIELRGWHVI